MVLADREYIRDRHRGPPFRCGPPGIRDALWGTALVAIAAVSWLAWTAHASPTEGTLHVNLNTANQSELESLPHIGPARARLIIAARPFKSVSELARIRGISPALVQELSPLVTVNDPTTRLDDRSLLDRAIERARVLKPRVIIFYLMCATFAAAYLVRWLACLRLRRRNARTVDLFNEAERRRWEGHRRDRQG